MTFVISRCFEGHLAADQKMTNVPDNVANSKTPSLSSRRWRIAFSISWQAWGGSKPMAWEIEVRKCYVPPLASGKLNLGFSTEFLQQKTRTKDLKS